MFQKAFALEIDFALKLDSNQIYIKLIICQKKVVCAQENIHFSATIHYAQLMKICVIFSRQIKKKA